MDETTRLELVRALEAWIDATSHRWQPTDEAFARALCRVVGAELYWQPREQMKPRRFLVS